MAHEEKPEVKTLTQGVSYRAGGLGFAETVGIAGAAGLLESAAAGEVDDRSLHASGETCARCERPFTPDSSVRRTVAGDLIHDTCPYRDRRPPD